MDAANASRVVGRVARSALRYNARIWASGKKFTRLSAQRPGAGLGTHIDGAGGTMTEGCCAAASLSPPSHPSVSCFFLFFLSKTLPASGLPAIPGEPS